VSGEAIARSLRSILDGFGITGQIQNVVTGSAANFRKPLSLHISDVRNTDRGEYAEDGTDDSAVGVDISEVLVTTDVDSEDGLVIHKRCGNHTLKLMCTTDAPKARCDANYKWA